MENKPCVKCGNPSLKEWNGLLVSPINRPCNICEECWDKLDEQQKEFEREVRTIRLNENGDLWLGRHKVLDLIEMCNKVMDIITIYESRISKLEADNLKLIGEMLDLTSTMTNKVIAMNESIRIWNNYIKEGEKQ
jgi:hypothetical protein